MSLLSSYTADRERSQLRRAFAEAARQDDAVRRGFLRRLRAARVAVSEWEGRLVADLLANDRPLTAAQRGAVDDLRDRYEEALP